MKISKRKYVTVFYAVVVALAVIKEPLLGCCDSTETNEAVVTDTVQNVPAVVAEIGEKPHKYNQLIDGYSLDIKTIIESLTYVLQQYCRTRHKIRQGTPEMIYMIIRT